MMRGDGDQDETGPAEPVQSEPVRLNFATSLGIKVNRQESDRILIRGLEFHGLWPQNSLKICQNRFLEWHFLRKIVCYIVTGLVANFV